MTSSSSAATAMTELKELQQKLTEKRLKRNEMADTLEELKDEMKTVKRQRLENPIHQRRSRAREEKEYEECLQMNRKRAQTYIRNQFGPDAFIKEQPTSNMQRWFKNAYQQCSENVLEVHETDYNLVGRHDIYISGKRLVYLWGPTKQLIVAQVQDNEVEWVDVYDATPYTLELLDASKWKQSSTLEPEAEAFVQKSLAGKCFDSGYSDDSGDDEIEEEEKKKEVPLYEVDFMDYKDGKMWKKCDDKSDDIPSGDPHEWGAHVWLAGCFLAGGVDQGCVTSDAMKQQFSKADRAKDKEKESECGGDKEKA